MEVPRLGAADRAALAALVLGALASLIWLVHPWFDAVNDAALYLLTAKALAAGEGYTYLGEPFIIRPPGFSVLLAPLVAWRGFDFHAVHLFVGAFGVLAIALLFLWTRPALGTLLAFGVAVCVWLNPGWRTMTNQAMSDVPGAALLLACLLLSRWAKRAPSSRRDALLGALIGLSAYVRSANVLLVPAILLERAIDHRKSGEAPAWMRFVRERALVLAAVPVLILLPWKIRENVRHPIPPVDQTSLYSYSTGMWHADRGDPDSPRLSTAAILARVPTRAREIAATLGSRLARDERSDESEAPIGEVVLGAVGLAIALVFLVRANRAEGWFLLGTLAVILVYFDFRARLVLPVHMLALPALVEAGARALRWLSSRVRPWLSSRALRRFSSRALQGLSPRAATPVLLAILALLTALDFHPRRDWPEIEREHRGYQELCDRLAQRLPERARLAVPYASWRYSIYLGRPVYALFFAWARRGDASGAEAMIDKYGIDHVVISDLTQADRDMRPYFVARYGAGENVGDVTLVRVR